MTQVEIAKKILEQGYCQGILCIDDSCPFKNNGPGCSVTTRKVGNKYALTNITRVKQWLKEQEKEMIDLTVNQILTEPVKCWVKSAGYWIERWLISIDDNEYCVINNYCHSEKTTLVQAVLNGFTWYKECTLTDPTKPKFKPWLKVEDVPVELWGKALFKKQEEESWRASMLEPNMITTTKGNLYENLVYLPLGQPLDSEWLEMGEWV